ncbi:MULTISPECIES: tRNA 2-thiocytidine biosynthesis TtcA family protein [unclassified Oceanispirochaeta]|nr:MULTISPECIES: tRNA 2-thiocytidine biosynthesis TtcA family protein [unclassified Oceanispirochaeta]MBF9017352.1 tRNA 2-thiocytidine biosynthesis protein TtcA [Oceanispirochaeta sp. M2]NPD73727.1 tRNA 2-thiocytidine biosynthesis protein TtcA [Oceanispirochaeta sp. M1]RDG30480.1 tRNA 2-thiocytidine biosynthesis protein TtcA [Oceanispirochaeta sp. M1]
MAKNSKGLLSKRLSRAVMEYNLIQKDDRVLVALSGGKDSLVLTWLLHRMSRSFPVPFSVHALHVRSEVHPRELAPALETLMKNWEVPHTILDSELKSFLRPGQELNCFICARKRRESLLKYAQENNFQSIALGHHMDDILQTLIMNMSWKGELAAMPPRLEYKKDLSIIRPLSLVQEHYIRDFAREMEWTIPAKNCPYEGKSRRKEAAAVIEKMCEGKDSLKYNMFNSLRNIKEDLLPPAF